jgi:HEAT repeats
VRDADSVDVVDQVVRGDTHTAKFYDALTAASPSELVGIVGLHRHADPIVRRSVAAVLPFLVEVDDAPRDVADALIALTTDVDDRVRDYACFGLGQQCRELDSAAIRDALAARMDDSDVETRCEALLGLAYRHDPRALSYVREALARPDGNVWMLELQAAGAFGDPSLHRLVAEHLEGWDESDAAVVDAVYRLTDPAGIGLDVLGGVGELYRRRAHGEPDGTNLGWWHRMETMLDIAPDRAADFLRAVAALLADDPAATEQLLHQSALSTFARD